MNIIRKLAAVTLLLLTGTGVTLQAQEEELLPPEQAFALTAWMQDNSVIAEYRIAPGYYMYRERFAFEIEASDTPARFGAASMPPGKIMEDEFFGKMETYRDAVRIRLPIIFDAAAATELRVKAMSQGCADIGVCYPPQKQALALQIASSDVVQPVPWVAENPAPEASSQNVAELQSLLDEVTVNLEKQQASRVGADEGVGAVAVLQALGNELGLDDEDEILHPDEAFILSARLDANNIIQTHILLAKNIYLYRDKIKIALVEGAGHSLGPISVPRGKQKDDPFLGPMEVIYDEVGVSIPIISDANASGQFRLSYQYQGCVEDRICYPPVTKYLEVDTAAGLIKVSHERVDGSSDGVISTPAISDQTPVSEQETFARLLQGGSLLLIVSLFFIAGIGLTFTPCVFPMIPILSSIIAGQGESITTRKAFVLSLVYVLSMAVTYATAGAIVGFYGAEFNIQIWFQDPVILSIFAAIFVLLSLSMFGFYELQMPNAIQSRLTAISNSQQGGTLIGVGLMGFFSAIIVGPCITAPLVGALLFISQSQDWLLGGLALFALGLGMGVPLLLVGTSAGKLLPRAGGWMDRVKAAFGVVMLGVAIWLLERILPVGVTMTLIAALLVATAIYLGALDSLSETASGWRRFAKSIGLLVLIYGVAYLVGAAAGSRDLIQPLRGVMASLGTPEQSGQHLAFRQIKGQQGLQLALNDSTRQGRTTMLDFYADWCISCKEMERYTFTHPEVLAALDQTTALQADVTANDDIDTKLMSSLGIYGPPAILFYDTDGNEIRHRRVVGEMSGEEFAAHVRATFQ